MDLYNITHNYPHEPCHEKTDLKIFVAVIPKEGRAGAALPILLWVSSVVSVIPKEGLAGPILLLAGPILLLESDGIGTLTLDVHVMLLLKVTLQWDEQL